jgi:release factor glutamine methyltransferase
LKLKDVKLEFIAALSGRYPSEEVLSFFTILSEHILKYSRLETALNASETLSEENQLKFEMAIARLKEQEPIQYITGQTEFYGLPFKVNEHTLIPRPETEELVEWIVSEVSNDTSEFNILDVGTGSGCIAISLANSLKNAKVSALDVSSEALEMARRNSEINNTSVDFFSLDVLTALSLPQEYQLIVSNPPYVRELEKKAMHPNVLEYEPATALFVTNEDPLLFYRKIAALAMSYLSPGGQLYFEINEYLSKELIILLKAAGFLNIEIKKDIFGKDRMLRCFTKNNN